MLAFGEGGNEPGRGISITAKLSSRFVLGPIDRRLATFELSEVATREINEPLEAEEGTRAGCTTVSIDESPIFSCM